MRERVFDSDFLREHTRFCSGSKEPAQLRTDPQKKNELTKVQTRYPNHLLVSSSTRHLLHYSTGPYNSKPTIRPTTKKVETNHSHNTTEGT